MLKKPAIIHLYDEDGNQTAEYKLCIIPWKLMKKATAIFEKFGENENSEMQIDEMTKFLCEAYQNRFSPDDLGEHGDAAEVMQAISAIMEGINATSPNVAAGAAPQK